ncbi:ABC transporter ATP-binding protein [Patescibacteria group bacterium]
MAHALDIKNLVKDYGKLRAVNDISFVIERGEFFGFLGPNGAGKTSTISCATGIAKITSGSIKVFGIDVEKDYRNARKKVGLSPQEFNVDIFAPTWKILDYVGGFFGLRKAERAERIERLLNRFDLEQYRNKQFRELSGGFKRRVMIARAMVHNPDLLILDEPTAGVDVELRHELWKFLQELNQEGKTILLTSHYLEEVELLCNRIAIINKGVIAAIGNKSDFVGEGRKLEQKYLELTRKGND